MVRPPVPHGSPFFITNKSITELHTALAQRAGVYRRLAWCVGGVGGLLLVCKAARHGYVRYKEHQARERVRKALARMARGDSSNAAGPAGSTAAAAGLDAAEAGMGGSSSRDSGMCVVCLSAPSEMVYVRCGHMCCCARCSQALGAKRCPVCRAEGNVIKVFRT
eukprot:GHRQ01006481.1.p2 GENE.GHRQ01006481.1~~GHRQ01006481.1.p2  ORF type:complete len:164 (+),score=61.46 GHRQ01006481.1:864-1355(+)